MTEPNEQQVELGFRIILAGLGIDLDNPHTAETPARAARAWFHELCRGLTTPPPRITTFPSEHEEMVLLRRIPIHSLCAHHFLPFHGHAVIGYIPGGGRIFGLSKLSRIADYWARRPQVQEELTTQIADHIVELLQLEETGRGGVGVVIRANHMCMALRGVKHEGDMITSALRGIFRTVPEVREEFLRLAYEGSSGG